MLLIAAGTLWLFLAAVPAFADGGPHIASANSGVSSLTTDSCAGCHRVHTAQAPMLLKTDEEGLCLSCHGAAVTGATTDVESGLQYDVVGGTGIDAEDRDPGVIIGALRAGGFEETYIGDPAMYAYLSGTSVRKNSKIQVASVPSPVTSAHLPDIAGLTGTLTQPGIAWGNGSQTGATANPGPAATIGCASCHNPHGNGQYRILNPVPAGTGINAAWTVRVYDYGIVAPDTYRTVSSHGLLNGDQATVTGMTGGGNQAVAATVTVVSDTQFKLSGVTGGSGTGNLPTSIVTRIGGVEVTDDATTDPAVDTRNYTVIQTVYTAPTLTATAAATYDPTDGDYFHYKVPWNGTSGTNIDAPNGLPTGTATRGGFSEQMTAWCASCHTRYFAWSEPTENPDDGATTGAAYANPRPGDDIFKYQHRTRGASGRSCTTCHVSHGSSAVMDGQYAGNYLWPNQVPAGIDDPTVVGSNNSRLLKVDNRGTCVLCHDPSGTLAVGDENPIGASTLPAP
jgi:predicted CXXCH cytochrome family protein